MMFIANLIKIFKYKFVAFLFGAAGWGLHARRQTSNGGSARKNILSRRVVSPSIIMHQCSLQT